MFKFCQTIFLTSLVLFLLQYFSCLGLYAFDLNSASFSLSADTKDIDSLTETRKIEELLNELEKNWNEHNIEKVLANYADGFINGDGLTLEAVKTLTVDLWETYPDIQTQSQERAVRVYGEYATVESSDIYEGQSSMIRTEVGTKGTLRAISVGQLFLKKFGPTWKITSDKTIFEKVSIGYGIGAELVDKSKVKLSSPEQVPSGQQYTARLDFDLSEDIKPVAAISKEVLVFPQSVGEDKFRLINEPKLERLLAANRISRNELITATIGLTGGPLKPKLLGLVFLSRRVNVVPISDHVSEVSIIKTPAKSALTKSIEQLDVYQTDEQKNNIQKNKPDEDNKEKKDIPVE